MSIRNLLVSLSILLFEGVGTYCIAQKKQSEILNHKVTFELALLENLNSALRETNISITPPTGRRFSRAILRPNLNAKYFER